LDSLAFAATDRHSQKWPPFAFTPWADNVTAVSGQVTNLGLPLMVPVAAVAAQPDPFIASVGEVRWLLAFVEGGVPTGLDEVVVRVSQGLLALGIEACKTVYLHEMHYAVDFVHDLGIRSLNSAPCAKFEVVSRSMHECQNAVSAPLPKYLELHFATSRNQGTE